MSRTKKLAETAKVSVLKEKVKVVTEESSKKTKKEGFNWPNISEAVKKTTKPPKSKTTKEFDFSIPKMFNLNLSNSPGLAFQQSDDKFGVFFFVSMHAVEPVYSTFSSGTELMRWLINNSVSTVTINNEPAPFLWNDNGLTFDFFNKVSVNQRVVIQQLIGSNDIIVHFDRDEKKEKNYLRSNTSSSVRRLLKEWFTWLSSYKVNQANHTINDVNLLKVKAYNDPVLLDYLTDRGYILKLS